MSKFKENISCQKRKHNLAKKQPYHVINRKCFIQGKDKPSGEHSLKKAGRPRLENNPLREYWRRAKQKQKERNT